MAWTPVFLSSAFRVEVSVHSPVSTMSDTRPLKKPKVTGLLKSALKKPKEVSDAATTDEGAPHEATVEKRNTSPKGISARKVVAMPKISSENPVSRPTKPDKGKAKAVPDARLLPTTFKVVAGSYEKLLYGLEGSFAEETDDNEPSKKRLRLKPIFIFPAHIACVKAVAASPDGGKWLATGSTDESIKIWDLRRRKEHGSLAQHEGLILLSSPFSRRLTDRLGSITHLSFPTRSHLISASEDGTICIFRTRDWILLRSLKGHKGRVNSVAVHPSMKVALSVGKDRTLRMWDLMRGKGSASTKLGKGASFHLSLRVNMTYVLL